MKKILLIILLTVVSTVMATETDWIDLSVGKGNYVEFQPKQICIHTKSGEINLILSNNPSFYNQLMKMLEMALEVKVVGGDLKSVYLVKVRSEGKKITGIKLGINLK